MKKYVAGVLSGVLMSVGTVGAFAVSQNYTLSKYEQPIYINGVMYPTDALPVLTLQANGGGNTYVPLRNFSEMMGADVSFNSSLGRIDITNSGSSASTAPSTSNNTTSNIGNTSSGRVYNSTYRLNVYTVNGVEYVDTDEIDDVYFDDDYKRNNDEYEFEERGFGTNITVNLEYDDRVVLSSIEAIKHNGEELIRFDYFVNNIYPMVK